MAGTNAFLRWQWENNVLGVDLIRAFLGVALLVRGLLFLFDPSRLEDLTPASPPAWMVYAVTFAHIVGGAMLAVGLFTRIGALIQIPILAGAVFVVHFREGLLWPRESFELSALVLFILVVLLIYGPGKASLDYYFFGRRTRLATPTGTPPPATPPTSAAPEPPGAAGG